MLMTYIQYILLLLHALQIEFDYVNLVDFEGAQLRFADGAGSDNDGIIGLLRRGVSTIVASSATFTAPTGTATDWATGKLPE